MKNQLLSIGLVVTLLPLATGCGICKEFLFGPGAPCTACAAGYNVAPPAYAGPGIGCGVRGCVPPAGVELGCGGETVGSYYGAYPSDGTIIGGQMFEPGFNGAMPYDAYNGDNWLSVVPGSTTVTEGVPTPAGMSPAE